MQLRVPVVHWTRKKLSRNRCHYSTRSRGGTTHQTRDTPYRSNRTSLLMRVMPSIAACASNSLSNGSLWCGGNRAASWQCAKEIESVPRPLSLAAASTFSAMRGKIGSFPSSNFTAISQHETALRKTEFASSSMAWRATAVKRPSLVFHQRNACVSRRKAEGVTSGRVQHSSRLWSPRMERPVRGRTPPANRRAWDRKYLEQNEQAPPTGRPPAFPPREALARQRVAPIAPRHPRKCGFLHRVQQGAQAPPCGFSPLQG